MTEELESLDARGQTVAVPWLVRWAPLLLTLVVVTLIVTVRTVTWPEAPKPGDAAIANGFLIAIEDDGKLLSYGFDLPDGSRVFDKLLIGSGVGEANEAYGWERQGAGALILVAYDSSDTSVSLPYLEYPYWGTAAWALLVASILLPIAVWARRRMYPSTIPVMQTS
ncbi:MAG: hypothetical protein O2884_14065 [Chloroflexi bacterium]|nr:hypothetical protein [Chloroflexota bacterium]